jgi:hypothetical protein
MELNEYLSESHQRRKKRRYQILLGACIVGVGFVITGILWIFFWSPLFRVQRFDFEGNKVVSDDALMALANTAFGVHGHLKFLGIGNMLAWPSSFSSSDLALIPQLSSATISKDYMNRTITIAVKERQPFAIWCSIHGSLETDNADCYWFDASGTMFAQAFDAEGSLILAVHDYSQSGLGIEKQIAPERFVQNIVSILDVLQASGLRAKEIRLNDIGLEEIQVTTYDGPTIYFSIRFSADNALPVLQSLMAKSGFDGFQYVDFRTQDRVYYK